MINMWLFPLLTMLSWGGDLRPPEATQSTGFSLTMPPGCLEYAECVQVENNTNFYLAPRVQGQRHWRGARAVKDENGQPNVIYDGHRLVSVIAPGQTAWVWALETSDRFVARAYKGDVRSTGPFPLKNGQAQVYSVQFELSRYNYVGRFIGGLRVVDANTARQARLVVFYPSNTTVAAGN